MFQFVKHLYCQLLRGLCNGLIYVLNKLFLFVFCKQMNSYRYQVKDEQIQILVEGKGYQVLHYLQGNYQYKSRAAFCRSNQLLINFVYRSHY